MKNQEIDYIYFLLVTVVLMHIFEYGWCLECFTVKENRLKMHLLFVVGSSTCP